MYQKYPPVGFTKSFKQIWLKLLASLFTDLSNIPNASSVNEEPPSLEVKPLTPRETTTAAQENQQVQSSKDPSPEPRPSTFAFPSEDEPVTMISKSIPPSMVSTSSSASQGRQQGQGGQNLIYFIVIMPLGHVALNFCLPWATLSLLV